MALAATAVGRRTLVAGERRAPLYERGGRARTPDDRRRGELTWRPHRERPGSVAASEREPGAGGRFDRGELEPHTEEHLLDEFEGERPGRKLHGFPAHRAVGARRRAVAVRHLLGVRADVGAAVPADLPVGRAAADVHGLPRRPAPQPRRPPGGEPDRRRLGARHRRRRLRRLRGRDRRRAVPPRGRARDARRRDGGRGDAADPRGDAPHGRLDPARDRARLRRLRLPRRADPRLARARAQGLRRGPHRRPGLHGPGGRVRHPARRRRDLHRAVHDLRRRARVLGRRALLRGDLLRRVRAQPHRPGTHHHAGRLPARHRVGLRRRHDRHARLGHVAAAAPRRLPQERGRRRARGGRHRRDPVAADARRGRLHHRRVPGDLLPAGARLRARPDVPLLPRDPARDRGRHAALQGRGPRDGHARLLAAARALGLPLLVADPDRDPAGAELLAVPRRRVRDRAGVPALVPGQARPDGPAQGLGRARGGRARGAADRRHARRPRASSSRSSRSPASAWSCRR